MAKLGLRQIRFTSSGVQIFSVYGKKLASRSIGGKQLRTQLLMAGCRHLLGKRAGDAASGENRNDAGETHDHKHYSTSRAIG